MQLTVYAAMFGFPVVAAALFGMLPARRAVLACYLGGWLFLPNAQWAIAGIPDYNKVSAVTFVTLALAVLFDSGRFVRLRPSLLDLPVAAWCLVPIATASANGLGMYEGTSHMLDQVVEWGLPYLIGRAYFADAGGIGELARAIVIAGAAYAPFCLWEAKMSPRLHEIVYGFQQHDWIQTVRFEGWRPQVFLQHGLAAAMFMAMSTVVAAWLWLSGTIRTIAGFPLWAVVGTMFCTTALCRSGLAAMLMVVGLGSAGWMKFVRLRLAILALVVASPMYIYARTAGSWGAEPLVAFARSISEDRAQSLEARLKSEDILWAHARERALFGWGRASSRPEDEQGQAQGVQDGYWIIAAGVAGLAGLTAMMGTILLPPLAMLRRLPGRAWGSRIGAPAAALSVVLALVMCDNVLNAMYNPVWILCAGAVSGAAIALGRTRRRAARPPRPVGGVVPA